MAKVLLPTNFLDDELNASMHGTRQYKITRADGSSEIVTIEDISEYNIVGNEFGAEQINQTNMAVNASADSGKIIDSLATIRATTQGGYMAGALAVKELDSQINSNIQMVVRSNGDIPCPPNTETEIARFGPVVPGGYFVDWFIHFNDHGHKEGTREAQYGTNEGFFAQTSVTPAPANSSGNGATISEISGLIIADQRYPYICAYVNHSANKTLNVSCFGQIMRVR